MFHVFINVTVYTYLINFSFSILMYNPFDKKPSSTRNDNTLASYPIRTTMTVSTSTEVLPYLLMNVILLDDDIKRFSKTPRVRYYRNMVKNDFSEFATPMAMSIF